MVCDDDHVVAVRLDRRGERHETGRINPVVVGDENPHTPEGRTRSGRR
jgi:hypothetical protein